MEKSVAPTMPTRLATIKPQETAVLEYTSILLSMLIQCMVSCKSIKTQSISF